MAKLFGQENNNPGDMNNQDKLKNQRCRYTAIS
jgi:hypothetical protein